MHRRAFVLGASAAALAAGPAAGAKPKAADALAHVKTVGVISTLGRAFTLQFIGFTVFNNTEKPLPIEDWKIDERVEARVKAHLGARFEFRAVDYDPAAFALPKKSVWGSPSAAKAVKDLPDQGLDAFILVTPQWTEEANYRRPFPIGGLGVIRDGDDMRGRPVDKVHAIYEITIVDAKTKAVLAQSHAAIPKKAAFGFASPVRRMVVSQPRDDPATMPPQRKYEIREEVEGLLDLSLDFTLFRMGLTGEPAA